MARRTTPQNKRDKHAWPVTLRVLVPCNGYQALGRDTDPFDWLRLNIGSTECAHTPHRTTLRDGTEFHFRCIEDAELFLSQFPMLELADVTTCKTYSSPHLPFGRQEDSDVCNNYQLQTTQEAMQNLFTGIDDNLGNLEPSLNIFPNTPAPVVRHGADGLEMVNARWGMPTPPMYIKGKADRGVTNVRNAGSAHWRRWLGPENRCLVPWSLFAEPVKGGNAWFRLKDDRQGFFAGIETREWKSVRKVKDGETVDDVFAFLTTEPNAVVKPVHHKAMPVILTEQKEWDTWLNAPWNKAKALQRPLTDDALEVLSR